MSLSLDAVTVSFANGLTLFEPLTLTIPAGDLTVIMGPSGSGKSTLLDAIGGHLAAVFIMRGSIQLNGRPIHHLPAERRRVGLVFQDPTLFPHLSVGENLAFGLDSSVVGRDARRAAIREALRQAGLEGMESRDPATLSGGQRARVALLRTLLAKPHAVLLDEPFSSLDLALRAEMRAFTLEHLSAHRIPALLVSHDPADALAATGPVIDLARRSPS